MIKMITISTIDNTDIIVYPVPWDLTTTGISGTAVPLSKLRNIMHQLDESHPFTHSRIKMEWGTFKRNINHAINPHNIEATQNHSNAKSYGLALNIDAVNSQRLINEACQKMNKIVYQDIQQYLSSIGLLYVEGNMVLG